VVKEGRVLLGVAELALWGDGGVVRVGGHGHGNNKRKHQVHKIKADGTKGFFTLWNEGLPMKETKGLKNSNLSASATREKRKKRRRNLDKTGGASTLSHVL